MYLNKKAIEEIQVLNPDMSINKDGLLDFNILNAKDREKVGKAWNIFKKIGIPTAWNATNHSIRYSDIARHHRAAGTIAGGLGGAGLGAAIGGIGALIGYNDGLDVAEDALIGAGLGGLTGGAAGAIYGLSRDPDTGKRFVRRAIASGLGAIKNYGVKNLYKDVNTILDNVPHEKLKEKIKEGKEKVKEKAKEKFNKVKENVKTATNEKINKVKEKITKPFKRKNVSESMIFENNEQFLPKNLVDKIDRFYDVYMPTAMDSAKHLGKPLLGAAIGGITGALAGPLINDGLDTILPEDIDFRPDDYIDYSTLGMIGGGAYAGIKSGAFKNAFSPSIIKNNFNKYEKRYKFQKRFGEKLDKKFNDYVNEKIN